MSYPWQCSALCCRLASSEATWPSWSLYSNFRAFVNKEVTALGGQQAAAALSVAFVFESWRGGNHVANTFALLGGMCMSPKVCHWVAMKPWDDNVELRTGDGHVGVYEFDREPFVRTMRDDVPECLGKVIQGAGNLGALRVLHGDELAAHLAKSGDIITVHLLSFVWSENRYS